MFSAGQSGCSLHKLEPAIFKPLRTDGARGGPQPFHRTMENDELLSKGQVLEV